MCVYVYVHACVWCVLGNTTHIATFLLGAHHPEEKILVTLQIAFRF